jgi:hypothetical protein
MKNRTIFIIIVSFISGFVINHVAQKWDFISKQSTSENARNGTESNFALANASANDRLLASMYPSEVGRRVMMDLRIVECLKQNDLQMSLQLAKLDVQSGVDALDCLRPLMPLPQLSSNALASGQQFLKTFRTE